MDLPIKTLSHRSSGKQEVPSQKLMTELAIEMLL